jgi:hypothetical protein
MFRGPEELVRCTSSRDWLVVAAQTSRNLQREERDLNYLSKTLSKEKTLGFHCLMEIASPPR